MKNRITNPYKKADITKLPRLLQIDMLVCEKFFKDKKNYEELELNPTLSVVTDSGTHVESFIVHDDKDKNKIVDRIIELIIEGAKEFVLVLDTYVLSDLPPEEIKEALKKSLKYHPKRSEAVHMQYMSYIEDIIITRRYENDEFIEDWQIVNFDSSEGRFSNLFIKAQAVMAQRGLN